MTENLTKFDRTVEQMETMRDLSACVVAELLFVEDEVPQTESMIYLMDLYELTSNTRFFGVTIPPARTDALAKAYSSDSHEIRDDAIYLANIVKEIRSVDPELQVRAMEHIATLINNPNSDLRAYLDSQIAAPASFADVIAISGLKSVLSDVLSSGRHAEGTPLFDANEYFDDDYDKAPFFISAEIINEVFRAVIEHVDAKAHRELVEQLISMETNEVLTQEKIQDLVIELIVSVLSKEYSISANFTYSQFTKAEIQQLLLRGSGSHSAEFRRLISLLGVN